MNTPLIPPKSSDSESTRKARLFFITACGSVCIITGIMIISCFVVPALLYRWLITIAVTNLATLVFLILNAKGFTKIASILFTCMLFILILGLAWSGGGIRAGAIQFIPVVILIAGLQLGEREGILVGVLAACGGLGLVLAEIQGYLPLSVIVQSPITLLIISVLSIASFTFLQFVSVKSLNMALSRARQELALRLQSESRLKSISENFSAGMFYQVDIHPDGRREFTYVSDSVRKLYGITPEEVMADAGLIYGRVYKDDVMKLKFAEDEAIKTFATFKIEARIQDPSGEIRWSSFVSTPRRIENGVIRWDGVEVVITERKQIEAALQKSESLLSSISEGTTDAIFVKDRQGRYLMANKAVLQFLGKTLEEVIGMDDTAFFSPEDADFIMSNDQKVMDGGNVRNYEEPLTTADGMRRVFLTAKGPVRNGNGDIIGIFGIDRDITDRKQIEGLLRFISQRTWVASGKGFLPALAEHLGHLLKVDYVLIDKISDEPRIAETVGLYAHGKIVRNMSYSLAGTPCENVIGKDICVYSRGVRGLFPADELLQKMNVESYLGIPLWNSSGQGIGMIAVLDSKPLENANFVTDLLRLVAATAGAELERAQAEKSMRESEKRYRDLIENAGQIINITQEGKLQYTNPITCKITGYSMEELLRKPFPEFIHPDDRERVMQHHVKRLDCEPQPVYSFRLIRKDKRITWLEVSAVIIQWEGKTATLNFMTEVTERKEAEEYLKSSLKEKETLLQELYHRTKNNMMVIASLLELQGVTTACGEAKRIIKDNVLRIRTMALAHEKLYKTQSLSQINMKEYIPELATLLKAGFGISAEEIEMQFDIEDIRLLIDVAIPCGLIINELVSNCFKYAFPEDMKGTIMIELHKRSSNELELKIGDNGVGVAVDINASPTLGLKLVKKIAKYQLHGSVCVESKNGLIWFIRFRDNLYSERV